jgi:hypothetical protein
VAVVVVVRGRVLCFAKCAGNDDKSVSPKVLQPGGGYINNKEHSLETNQPE